MTDIYQSYELELEELVRRLDKDDPHFAEVLTLQARLIENIAQTRRYGDTETRRAERMQTIDALNRLAVWQTGNVFGQLRRYTDGDMQTSVPPLIHKLGLGEDSQFYYLVDMLLLHESQEYGFPIIVGTTRKVLGFRVLKRSRRIDSSLDPDQLKQNNAPRLVEELIAFQYHFLPSNFIESSKTAIIRSLENLLAQFPDLYRWILITPEDFSEDDSFWFDELKTKYERQVGFFSGMVGKHGLSLEHWGHHELIRLLRKHPKVGRQYYPELFGPEYGQVEIASIRMDDENCDWYRYVLTNHIKHQYMPYYMKFIYLNYIVRSYEELDTLDRSMFQDTFRFLVGRAKDAISTRANSMPTQVTESVRSLIDLDLPSFYKYLVLYNRFGRQHLERMLESGETIYDVEKEDPCFGHRDKARDSEFYVYDLAAIPYVVDAVRVLWPDEDEYSKLIRTVPYARSLQLFKKVFLRTTNPIFDICLVNNTNKTQVLCCIDVIIEDVWTEVKAGPLPQALKPIALFSFRLDFSQTSNSFFVDTPITIGSEQAVRFRVQLEEFIADCPGNWAKIRLCFVLSDMVVCSESLLMDF